MLWDWHVSSRCSCSCMGLLRQTFEQSERRSHNLWTLSILSVKALNCLQLDDEAGLKPVGPTHWTLIRKCIQNLLISEGFWRSTSEEDKRASRQIAVFRSKLTTARGWSRSRVSFRSLRLLQVLRNTHRPTVYVTGLLGLKTPMLVQNLKPRAKADTRLGYPVAP